MNLRNMRRLNPLVTWREVNRVSRTEAAARLGVSDVAVYKWESGSLYPSDESFDLMIPLTGIRDLKDRRESWFRNVCGRSRTRGGLNG